MRIRFFHEKDQWTTEGPKINSPENLERIRACLEDEGPIIVIHHLYRGASAPDRLLFNDYDDFLAYLNEQVFAGDMIEVWSFHEVFGGTSENYLGFGKCPDDDGRVPRFGAY